MRGCYLGIPQHWPEQGVVDGGSRTSTSANGVDVLLITLREERTRRAVRAMAPGPCSDRMRSWCLPGSSGCSATRVSRWKIAMRPAPRRTSTAWPMSVNGTE